MDDGQRLAATGVVWNVFGEDWEVVFTGSLGWKNRAGRRGNRRSHQIVLPGPHYVFVRVASLVEKNIVWEDLRKFHVQTFFIHGIPAANIAKSSLAIEAVTAKQFLRGVSHPTKWFDVRLVQEPEKVVKVETPEDNNLPRKRSRRIIDMERKAVIEDMRRLLLLPFLLSLLLLLLLILFLFLVAYHSQATT